MMGTTWIVTGAGIVVSNEIDLPGTVAADGDMVMENTYGIGEEEEEDGYGGEDDYYDEYGGGGGAVKEDASNK